MTAILEITDGTTTVSLINGNPFHLNDWTPNTAEPKAGGYYKDSPISDGKKLASYHWDNVIETFELKGGNSSQDAMIEATQDLRRLLVKAKDYWTSDWQDEPVYIKAKANDETNTRYALIQHGRLQSDDNYYAQPFLQPHCRAVMDELLLLVERGHWSSDAPGTGTCLSLISRHDSRLVDWESIDETASRQWVYGFTPAQASDGDLFGLMDDGVPTNYYVYKSANNGDTWAQTYTLAVAIISIAVDTDDYLYITSSDAGGANTRQSTDDGVNFPSVDAPGANYVSGYTFVLANDYILTAYKGSGTTQSIIRRSINGAASFSTVYTLPGLVAPTIRQFIQTGTGRVILLTSIGLVISDDNGATWTFDTFKTDKTPYIMFYSTVIDAILLGTGDSNDGEIYVSYDDGDSWGRGQIFSGAAIYSICDESDNSLLWIGDKSGVAWKSSDGLTWVQVSTLSDSIYNVFELANGNIIALANDTGNTEAETYMLGEYIELGIDDSCSTPPAYITNKMSSASPLYIYVEDNDGGPSYSDESPPASLPFDLFPAAPAVSDCINFGSVDGPFSSVVFDIGDIMEAVSYTIVWEYTSGAGPAWSTLSVMDNTDSFSVDGVNSVHWRQPSDWTEAAVNGVTGLWVRAKISAISNFVDNPTQQTRDIYAVLNPYVEVDDTDVLGDIPALGQAKLDLASCPEDALNSGAPWLPSSRVDVGLRSIDRGSSFVAYLNCSDEQWPAGVSISAGSATTAGAAITAPTGRKYTYNPTGLDDMSDRLSFSLSTSACRDFYGIFHAYLRCREYDASNDPGNIGIRLKISTGSGGIFSLSDTMYCQTINDWHVIDFGQISIPSANILGSSIGDQMSIIIQCSAESNETDLYLYDLILVPSDEWAGSFEDTRRNDNSFIDYNKRINIDSITVPKEDLRGIVGWADALEAVRAIYVADGNGPMILQANSDQRLWFMSSNYFVFHGTHDGGDDMSNFEDADGDLIRQGVKVGQTIVNETDGSSGVITQVSSTEAFATMTGGTGNDFDDNDVVHVITDDLVSYPEVAFEVSMWKQQRYLAARGSR